MVAFAERQEARNAKLIAEGRADRVKERAYTGKPTYIDQILTRLTVAGAAYITIICLMPEFMIAYAAVPFAFGGTSLLIVVVVIMDFMAQLQAHLMSHQYDGLLKKANLKGLGGAGSGDARKPGTGAKALGSNKAPTR